MDPVSQPLGEHLTRREREILTLLAEGLTLPEIAVRLTVATSSVKTHVQHVYGKLGVSHKRDAVIRAQALGLLKPAHTPAAPVGTTPPPIHNLPQPLTRFFGREPDIALVIERLAEWRLVTLTGSGGVGKSRLALRTAEATSGRFPDGIWLVELASLAGPSGVVRLVSATLGLPERTSNPTVDLLTSFLRQRQALLILDNCEHVLEPCARLAEALLRDCPRLRILATSREPLGVGGEAIYRVPSLPFPNPEQLPALNQLDTYAALSLFVDRAKAVTPDFTVTPQSAGALAYICQRLDGIPLALELAAARMNVLSAEQLVKRLDDVFRLLTAGSRTALPRHQTLRATIQWSYDLLSAEERLLLQRLSVFSGGCSLEAAEAICGDDTLAPQTVLENLAGLVQKSMVVASRQAGEDTRYRLLEMVRQFAGEELTQAGQTLRFNRRHWQYFQQLTRANSRNLMSLERSSALKLFLPDLENLALALDRSYEDPADLEAGFKMIIALVPLWFIWHRDGGWRWICKGLALIDAGAAISPPLLASFLAWASTYHWCGGRSRALAEQGLAVGRSLGPAYKETLCWSLWTMAVGQGGCYLELQPEDWDRAEALLDEQTALIGTLGPDTDYDPRLYQGYNLWLRAVLANNRGQYEPARAYALESLQLFQANFDDTHLVGSLVALGDTALRTGDYAQAHDWFSKALPIASAQPPEDVRYSDVMVLLCEAAYRRGDLAQAFEYCKTYLRGATPPHGLERLEMAARIFARAGRFTDAARLSGAAEALSEISGRPISSKTHAESYWGDWRTRFGDLTLEMLVPDWRGRPDAEAIRAAWDEGRAMTFSRAQAFALNDLEI